VRILGWKQRLAGSVIEVGQDFPGFHIHGTHSHYTKERRRSELQIHGMRLVCRWVASETARESSGIVRILHIFAERSSCSQGIVKKMSASQLLTKLSPHLEEYRETYLEA
jgi:hypothetical protein